LSSFKYRIGNEVIKTHNIKGEIIMERRTIAMTLSFIAALFFMAMAFDILPHNYALFGGIAFSLASGLTQAVRRQRQ
jgi:multidrug transporter EmrE-like cation transporter